MMQSTSCSRAVGGDDAVGRDARDRVGHELDVRPLQRGQEVRAEQHRACSRTCSPARPCARSSGSRSCQRMNSAERSAAEPPERARVADHQRQRLAVVEHERAAGTPARPARARSTALDQRAGTARLRARQEPVARALEDDELRRLLGDLRARTARRWRRCRSPRRACRAGRSRGPTRRSGSCGPRTSRARRCAGYAGWCSWPVATTTASASQLRPSARRRPSSGASSSSQRARGDLACPARRAGRRRARARPRAGSRGSRAAASTAATSRGAARTRTSRGGSARRTPRPGRCCGATCRRAPAPRSRIVTSSKPWRCSSIAAAIPPNPAPTMTTLTPLGSRPSPFSDTARGSRPPARRDRRGRSRRTAVGLDLVPRPRHPDEQERRRDEERLQEEPPRAPALFARDEQGTERHLRGVRGERPGGRRRQRPRPVIDSQARPEQERQRSRAKRYGHRTGGQPDSRRRRSALRLRSLRIGALVSQPEPADDEGRCPVDDHPGVEREGGPERRVAVVELVPVDDRDDEK